MDDTCLLLIQATKYAVAMLEFVRFLFHMGTKRIETTWDLIRFGANLRVTCRCGHVVTINGSEIDHVRRARNWPRPLGYLREKLVCSKCGRRPIAVDPTANDPTIRIGLTVSDRTTANRTERDEA